MDVPLAAPAQLPAGSHGAQAATPEPPATQHKWKVAQSRHDPSKLNHQMPWMPKQPSDPQHGSWQPPQHPQLARHGAPDDHDRAAGARIGRLQFLAT